MVATLWLMLQPEKLSLDIKITQHTLLTSAISAKLVVMEQ